MSVGKDCPHLAVTTESRQEKILLLTFILAFSYRFSLTASVERARVLLAGWSSLVARQAHNLKVVGSNPTPATPSRFFLSSACSCPL